MQIEDMSASPTTGILTQEDIAALASQLQGRIVLPDDANFEEARQVHIASTARPAMIVRAAAVADVVATVRFARERSLDLAVRSGGHSVACYGVVEGGVVLDLSLLRSLEFDAQTRMARLGTGLTWGEVAETLHPHHLGLTAGDTASVGVGGLLTGGGIGWFVRKYGLAIDRVRSIELVTADGKVLTASANEHPDLFWAVRGGGGNFGVATSFEVELHPAGMVYGGAIFYDMREAATVLPEFARYVASAPDELSSTALLMPAPPAPFIPPDIQGKPVVALALVYSGDFEEGNRVVDPLRRLGTPIADIVGPMPYPAIFQFTAEATHMNMQHHSRAALVDSLDDALISDLIESSRDMPSPGTLLQIRILGGALKRVSVDATAFAHRDKGAALLATVYGYDEKDTARHHAWVHRCYEAMRPFRTGDYGNFLGHEGQENIDMVYPPATLERLRRVKRQYDPTNLFHHNLNIAPVEE